MKQNQKLARHIDDILPQSGVRLWLMMQSIRLLNHLPGRSFIARGIQKEITAAAKAIDLGEDNFRNQPSRGGLNAA